MNDLFHRFLATAPSCTAVLGVVYLSLQVRLGRRLAKAQFISELAEDCRRHQNAYWKSRYGSIAQKEEYQGRMENFPLVAYLGFFEKLKLLLDSGVIDMESVDRLFAHRFFSTVHDWHVQDAILYSEEYKGCYSALFALHKEWVGYRTSRASLASVTSLDHPILFPKHSLEIYNPKEYNEAVENFKALSKWEIYRIRLLRRWPKPKPTANTVPPSALTAPGAMHEDVAQGGPITEKEDIKNSKD